MKIERVELALVVLLGGIISVPCLARTVFEDDFANGTVADSTSVSGFWSSGLAVAAGDANALNESGGTLTMTAGSNDGASDNAYSGVTLYSAISSNFNFFTKIRKYSVRGITFDDHGTSILNSSEQFRFSLLSDSAESHTANDALIVKVTPDGKIRLGNKQNAPGGNADGTAVHEFTGLVTDGTYGFDLTVGPVSATSQEYQFNVYTGTVPVSAGLKVGTMSLAKAQWGDGSGNAGLGLWTQELNVTGGNQYFDATLSDIVVDVDENMLYNAGFERGTTDGWQPFIVVPTLSMETTTVHDGVYACRVSNRTEDWHSVRRQVGSILTTGETYTVSIWARLGSGSGSGSTLQLATTDTEGTHFKIIDTHDLTSSGWTLLEGQITFEYTGTLTESFFFVTAPIGIDLLVDDASVVPYVPTQPKKGTVISIR